MVAQIYIQTVIEMGVDLSLYGTDVVRLQLMALAGQIDDFANVRARFFVWGMNKEREFFDDPGEISPVIVLCVFSV